MMMPKLDGVGFLKKIKGDKSLSSIPILVSSNLSSMKKVSDCLALGAVGYVLKSDESLDSIVQDIERILES
jgi:CheY-like chemotaxis protein